ncbi:hypothetical protein DERF_010120 [Dermatophagoides farinae]|uniref:Uncharacterized protein n=1 Tax=Dermatophagoides farinae TaxID=6954 RepID=A0A922HYA9_DERFA|nr:hypothetical protein DERF_010120 [Dermatophagoides farinae]
MVPQLPLYPLVQQELNSIARRIIVVEEIPTAIQHWYRLYGNSPRYGNFSYYFILCQNFLILVEGKNEFT